MDQADESSMLQVQRACKLWSGKGGFVFTSSAAVYRSEDGGPCSEDSSLVALGNSERTDRYTCRISGNAVQIHMVLYCQTRFTSHASNDRRRTGLPAIMG